MLYKTQRYQTSFLGVLKRKMLKLRKLTNREEMGFLRHALPLSTPEVEREWRRAYLRAFTQVLLAFRTVKLLPSSAVDAPFLYLISDCQALILHTVRVSIRVDQRTRKFSSIELTKFFCPCTAFYNGSKPSYAPSHCIYSAGGSPSFVKCYFCIEIWSQKTYLPFVTQGSEDFKSSGTPKTTGKGALSSPSSLFFDAESSFVAPYASVRK